MNLFKFGPGCDHTRQPLQRRPAPKPEFKLGLPGMGPVVSVGSNSQGSYIYYCPNCKSNLPPGENARWEALYARAHRPPASRPVAGASAKARSRSSTSGKSAGSGYQREAIGAKLRYDILTRDKNRCVKCGATKDQVRLHVDHKIPVSQGGTNDPSNLQTLCEKCNLGKGARRG
jgi:5-methylcytosine-specific restriction endonuclease McrA